VGGTLCIVTVTVAQPAEVLVCITASFTALDCRHPKRLHPQWCQRAVCHLIIYLENDREPFSTLLCHDA